MNRSQNLKFDGCIYPKYLWLLALSYTMVLVFANLFDPRLVNIFGWVTDAGTIIFPLTFLLSDVITEVYGYKHARQAVWIGFIFNTLFILYGFLVINMPDPPYPSHNDVFKTLFALDTRIIFASGISYLCSEPFNSYVLSKLKIKSKGRYMSLRFVASTIAASGVDSLIFGALAFAGVMNMVNLISLILTMWGVKVIMEICGLPLSTKAAKWLKTVEGLDIYDIDTHYNLFSLDGCYTAKQNKYRVI